MATNDNKIPTNPYNDKYSSLIRPIKIFLPPHSKGKRKGDEYDFFVGRERLMERLFNWLSDERKESGSYLITGFRGMGKTTLVNRVINRLTREIKQQYEPWLCLLVLLPIVLAAIFYAFEWTNVSCFPIKCPEKWAPIWWVIFASLVYFFVIWLVWYCVKQTFISKKKKDRRHFPYHKEFLDANVDRMSRGNQDDNVKKKYGNIKISINLGHEVLQERHILGLITTNVRDGYRKFCNSYLPHLWSKALFVLIVALLSLGSLCIVERSFSVDNIKKYSDNTKVYVGVGKSEPQFIIEDVPNGSWFSRTLYNVEYTAWKAFSGKAGEPIKRITRAVLFVIISMLWWWLLGRIVFFIPYFSASRRALKRLETLAERIVTTTDIETGGGASVDKSIFSLSLFNRRKRKTIPIADIREIETELADIINQIRDDCIKNYKANFIVVFDEMDKIDPAMMKQSQTNEMPEFTDSVKGFPDGMDSRERRRNVLKLLANIKLFVSTAKAKFVFISGRELYDAYLADLSDRDFAISSIFSGVINVDSFLTPEGGQTDVRSMSEWYIANRLIPREWLREKEIRNAEGRTGKDGCGNESLAVLKQEKPSLRWYYEYLTEVIDNLTEVIDKSGKDEKMSLRLHQDASYVIGFLHTFAAYLTHISNGSPKKIFLYFDKYLRQADYCIPMNDWGDICTVGEEKKGKESEQWVLYFEVSQQRVINFVHYLSNPIMGTITNDMSSYGDRFLVSLSFIIDHIYKHHNRSFSWRNLEQIPDLLKTSKAPELRDEVMSIMEYLSQTHVSPILIGLNEYKFHKSIAEEISVMSKISDEASAIFNFTLDESLSVITHNTRLLNYYIDLEKKQQVDNSRECRRRYQSIIARIHSNLGDLHYWDEDYYAASLEYRAAIETMPLDNPESDNSEESGFLTLVRCMLKLGLTYELRKLYPNAYQTYCRLISLLIENRWVDENVFGLSVIDGRTDGWQDKRQIMAYPNNNFCYCWNDERNFNHQFCRPIFNGNYNCLGNNTIFSVNFDGLVSSFANDLTIEKSQTINKLTLFEEIRYLYQAILAKLSILENLGMSGITQTNIRVAEGEFITLHKSVAQREKFIIAADFFRKLAEILYYKNSLTILSQNQDSFYASVYYDDHDLLANLDDFCMRSDNVNALVAKHDILFFFNELNNSASEKEPKFIYPTSQDGRFSLRSLYKELQKKLVVPDNNYLNAFNELSQEEKDRIRDNVKKYLEYNIGTVATNEKDIFYFGTVESCEHHCRLLRKKGLRTPCYACKYYTRSLRILAENMFVDGEIALMNPLTKSYGILKNSFKNRLLYTNSTNIRALALTLEGFGNVQYACASGDNDEGEGFRPERGITTDVVKMLQELCEKDGGNKEIQILDNYEKRLSKQKPLSRLDKSILYYWDAYRFYMMDSCYNEAVGCLNKILNLFVYYVEVVCYYGSNNVMEWKNEDKTIISLVGDSNGDNSFLVTLFRLITRLTGYKYDLANLNEINELKWIFSKEIRDNIDLTRLSIYPAIRSAWLRIVETRAKGLGFLSKRGSSDYDKNLYESYIKDIYPLITPRRRYETTFYEEVLGYYTKMRYNDHIMNDIMDGNPMIDHDNGGYSKHYHMDFYDKLYGFLDSPVSEERLDCRLFEIDEKDVDKRLKLIEYLIHDTLVCITNMVSVFTPHNHLTSYSKSFVGIVYNFYWEWSRKYEFLMNLYQYAELRKENRNVEAEKIIDSIWLSGSFQQEETKEDIRGKLKEKIDSCAKLVPINKDDNEAKYGSRSNRLYELLRHDIDDITINTIYSNYTAEMALKYYQMAEEANTEGEAYKELIGSLRFLNDDLNNDTCQFNIACDRFLLNTGVIREQHRRLEVIYKNSNVYDIRKGYIDGPSKLHEEVPSKNQFSNSQYINSEY